jgi:hypothetical protein
MKGPSPRLRGDSKHEAPRLDTAATRSSGGAALGVRPLWIRVVSHCIRNGRAIRREVRPEDVPVRGARIVIRGVSMLDPTAAAISRSCTGLKHARTDPFLVSGLLSSLSRRPRDCASLAHAGGH